MDALVEKPCGRCKRILPASEFNKDKYASTGLRSQCKDCMAIDRRQRAEYYRAWRQKPVVRAWYRRYRSERASAEKIKRDARNAARSLERQPCEVCGAQKAQAHHDDYSKPLDVRWLCTTHHAEWHKHNTPVCPEQEQAA